MSLSYPLLLLSAVVLVDRNYREALWVLESADWGAAFIGLSQVLLALQSSALVWRIVLVLGYRPAKACADEQLPRCLAIVPAYNEGRQVFETIRSIVRSDYPEGKLSVIAIDDGSKDDTWYWLQTAKKEFPKRVAIHRQPVNLGKRRALYEGFRRGRCDVFVTIDSDSIVEGETIRRLVSPFCRNPRVGAVAGNVRVLNQSEGIIPRMLEVSFAYSFDFIRASQSAVNAVLCTPGALSAYRAEVVRGLSIEWLNQKFLGRAANIGEDRAMTNLILRSGYHVHYQRDAVVYTKVPTSYRGLCRMFLRWERSNIRETLVMSGFAFRKFRDSSATGARINLLLGWLSLTMGSMLRLVTLSFLIWLPTVFFGHLLLAAIMASLAPTVVYAIRYRSINALWACPYSIFWVFGLWWIGLWALVTPHRNSWLSRGLVMPPKKQLLLNQALSR